MSKVPNTLTDSPERTATVAYKAYFDIVNKWRLDLTEQQVLLGIHDKEVFMKANQGKLNIITELTLVRVSYVIKIYKNLALIFEDSHQANRWLRRENKLFGGNTALEFVLSDIEGGLISLCALLEALNDDR